MVISFVSFVYIARYVTHQLDVLNYKLKINCIALQ